MTAQSKRWLLNLSLAVFIVALALFVRFQPGLHRQETRTSPLTPLTPEQITRIRLDRPGEEEIALSRDGQDWRLTAPVKARADRFRVDPLLHIATIDPAGTLPASADDLAKYGLEKPEAVLWLNDAEIRFGDTHAFSQLQYVFYNGKIVLLPKADLGGLTSKLADFFSPRLLEDDRKPVSFVLPKFRLHEDNGAWQVEPPNKNLSSDQINSFVDAWRYARALSVSSYDGKRPVGKVFIKLGNVNPRAGSR